MTTTITNELLAYAPELKDLVKSAETIEGLSTKNKAETLFSAVKVGFMEKVAHVYVDPVEAATIRKAATLYGVSSEADQIVGLIEAKATLTKQASLTKQAELIVAQDNFETLRSGIKNVDKLVKVARALHDNFAADLESDSIKKYSCDAYLCKQAAERGLTARYAASKNEAFEKLASALHELDTDKFTLEEKRRFADYITDLEKKAGIAGKGFDIYEEAFLTKQADVSNSMMVKLGNNKSVPISKIQAIAPDLKDALGADVVKEITGDPMNAKHVIESLPLDLKNIIGRYC